MNKMDAFEVVEYTTEPPDENAGVVHSRVCCLAPGCGWSTVLLDGEKLTIEQVQDGHAENHAALEE